nr:MAG: ORF1 [Torque teno midi virus]
MPFWWRRRRRRWLPYRQYIRTKRRKTYRRRRRYPRRNRKTFRRRRRRRRRKVRRKKQTITVKQWQPDSIVKCKIKGMGTLVLGANGRQLVCYTNVKQQLTPPKAPGGGGFGYEQYSLGFLYEQYKFKNNIWTKSNINKDLVRYLGVQFTFYRHQDVDFIVSYERQPPFNIDKYSYYTCHPKLLLLSKHKFIILSKFSKPNGKIKKKIRIRPPKQMITKWFFQENFSKFPLLALKGAAANLNYPNLGCCHQNQITTMFYLDINFYKQGNWAAHPSAETQPYKPWPQVPNTGFACWKTACQPEDYSTKINLEKQTPANLIKKYGITYFKSPSSYTESIDYNKGWFTSNLLTAQGLVQTNETTEFSWAGSGRQGLLPLNTCRYNPTTDTGEGNFIWLKSTLKNDYEKPTKDLDLIVQGVPLWLGLFGWLSFVIMKKKVQSLFDTYVVCLQSPSLNLSSDPGATTTVIPVDSDFRQGKWPYEEPITHQEHTHWWLNVYHQLSTLNAIVCSGPYIPKYDWAAKNTTWELHYDYKFFFKWGGPHNPDPQITDPQVQGIYPVPDTINTTVQIRDPAKQKYETLMHPWDYRRGILKSSALKRMAEHLSIDSTFEPDTPTKKKKKTTGPELTVPEEENQEILSTLHSLCEENIYQETPQNLQQLIQQQQEQQQQLKYNILKVISNLKEKQRELQLQTGMLL